jgi:hypothetical protein
VGKSSEDVGRGAEDEPQVNDHKSVGRKVSGMVEAVPRSVGVSWSSGSYSVKSTAEDEPDVGRRTKDESGIGRWTGVSPYSKGSGTEELCKGSEMNGTKLLHEPPGTKSWCECPEETKS